MFPSSGGNYFFEEVVDMFNDDEYAFLDEGEDDYDYCTCYDVPGSEYLFEDDEVYSSLKIF